MIDYQKFIYNLRSPSIIEYYSRYYNYLHLPFVWNIHDDKYMLNIVDKII